jgi:hypothetical protein
LRTCYIVAHNGTMTGETNYAQERDFPMTWQQVQSLHPNQWLVIEAIQTRYEPGKRILEEVQVITTCTNGSEARRRCEALRRDEPSNQYYYFHTGREQLEVLEGIRLGVQRKHFHTAVL